MTNPKTGPKTDTSASAKLGGYDAVTSLNELVETRLADIALPGRGSAAGTSLVTRRTQQWNLPTAAGDWFEAEQVKLRDNRSGETEIRYLVYLNGCAWEIDRVYGGARGSGGNSWSLQALNTRAAERARTVDFGGAGGIYEPNLAGMAAHIATRSR